MKYANVKGIIIKSGKQGVILAGRPRQSGHNRDQDMRVYYCPSSLTDYLIGEGLKTQTVNDIINKFYGGN